MISEPTGRELELHNYLLAHGAKQVSNVAHVLSVQEYPSDAIIVSAWFWSKRHGEHFCFDTFFDCSLIDDLDAPIKVLANIVLRQAAGIDEAGPPLR